MIKKKAIPFFLLSLIIFLSGCTELGRRGGDEPDTKTEFVLGTVVTVQIYDHASEALFDKIFDRLREIEEKMTINQENSEVLKSIKMQALTLFMYRKTYFMSSKEENIL